MANQYYYNGKYYSEPDYIALGQSLGLSKNQIYGSMQGQDWANQQLASGQSPAQITSSLGSLYTSMTPAQQASYNSFLSSGSTGGCGGGSCGGGGGGGASLPSAINVGSYTLPEFPEYNLQELNPAPLYETPESLQNYYDEMGSTLIQRMNEGLSLTPEQQADLKRSTYEDISKATDKALQIANQSLAARGLAYSGIAAQAESDITKTGQAEQGRAARDINAQLALANLQSRETAVNQLLSLSEQLGTEAYKVYQSQYNEWVQEVNWINQKNYYEYQKAAEIYGAESDKAKTVYLAGVEAKLAAYNAQVQMALTVQQGLNAMNLQQQQQQWETNVLMPLQQQYQMERIAAEIQGKISLADYEAALNQPSLFEQIISGIPIIGDAGRIFGWW